MGRREERSAAGVLQGRRDGQGEGPGCSTSRRLGLRCADRRARVSATLRAGSSLALVPGRGERRAGVSGAVRTRREVAPCRPAWSFHVGELGMLGTRLWVRPARGTFPKAPGTIRGSRTGAVGSPVTLGARWGHIPCLPQQVSLGCFDFVGAVEEWKREMPSI